MFSLQSSNKAYYGILQLSIVLHCFKEDKEHVQVYLSRVQSAFSKIDRGIPKVNSWCQDICGYFFTGFDFSCFLTKPGEKTVFHSFIWKLREIWPSLSAKSLQTVFV